MNTSFNNQSFLGQYISKGNVKTNNRFFPNKRVSIVELKPSDSRDIETLDDIKKDWRWSDFSTAILVDAETVNRHPEDAELFNFYVVTTQKKNFEKVDPKKVLAQAEISKDELSDNRVWIEYLQVRPDCKFGLPNRPYKRVGATFLDFCKEQFKGKKLLVCSLDDVVNFYKDAGFIQNNRGVGTMFYQA